MEALSGCEYVFSVRAIGTAPLRYQWLKDGSPIAGETRARLRLAALDSTSGGQYSVMVSNTAGVASANATLKVLSPSELRITKEPVDMAKFVGQSATFSANVEGVVAPTYQWFHQGRSLPSAKGPQLALTNLIWTDSGEYQVEIYAGTVQYEDIPITVIPSGTFFRLLVKP